MKNRNDKKEIELPVELVVNMLNDEEGAFDDILQFYDGYIKNAAKLSFTEEPDEDLIQEINIHLAWAVDLLRAKLLEQKRQGTSIIIICS